MNFCSQCKFAKVIENSDGDAIYCTRIKNATGYSSNYWNQTRTVFKKMNAYACASFIDKDVAEERCSSVHKLSL